MNEPARREPGPSGMVPLEERLRQAARREHALQSLLELGRELTVALDPFETSDLVLFNLMGQLAAARAALWLGPAGDDAPAVLVRAHGFSRTVIEGVGTACEPVLRERFAEQDSAVKAWALHDRIPPEAFALVRHAGVALFAPLRARGEVLGWLGLGERVDGSAYGEADLQVIESALGMVAVSFHNTQLYGRVREANRRLRASNEHLNELDQLKTEFLSNVNHELRTPLAVVLGTLECVLGQKGNEPKMQTLLASALEQSRKLFSLIENLLAFSRVRDARLVVHLGPADVGALLDACFLDRQPGVATGLRELALRALPELPPVSCDGQRTLQIVNELVDNAIKFTPRGSHITLGADRVGVEGASWVRIEVRDDGPGIAPERLGTLFNSFEQVDGSATRTAGGLGMGLALARALAERMGGRLTVESALGKGAAFRLWLPVA